MEGVDGKKHHPNQTFSSSNSAKFVPMGKEVEMRPPPPQLRNAGIPEEILIEEILPRLAVKSLSRFRCVSKTWQSLIESDRFIKIQYRNSAKNPRVIMFDRSEGAMIGGSLQSLLLNSKGESPSTNYQQKRGRVPMGCCNGLVCSFSLTDKSFSLWNPATGVSIEIPDERGLILVKCGFGRDETSGPYKVFAVLSEPNLNDRIGRLYSSSTNSWRTVPHGVLSTFCGVGCFVSGKLHWIQHPRASEHEIECFDLEREEFERWLELPPIPPQAPVFSPRPWLGEIGGCLAVLFDCKKNIQVWVMKEYGAKDSWFKRLVFPPNTVPRRRNSFIVASLFGEAPNGEIFIICNSGILVYSPKDDAFTTHNNNGSSFLIARVYVESLVSPRRMLDASGTSTRSKGVV